MASPSPRTSRLWHLLLLLLLSTCCLASPARNASSIRRVSAVDDDGNRIYLDDNRQPALFTREFGDCQGDSLINVTRFDAAYYKDNMTVLFHLAGSSALTNESLMLYIGVYAYGEPRFNLIFNPCNANIWSLCPLNASNTIEANGIIPVAQADVQGIPPIALSIPDFEGQAILRIFANSTQSQIGCYSAVVTNGQSFSHPAAVGTVLGLFALVAFVASIATAAYGDNISETRNHYAHSVSVFVVFAVLHHIFFTGALSVNWPSVLVAFWSNYAWSAGMIYSSAMQNSINQFLGENRGNISMVGSAASGVANDNLGGGYKISQIYKRATDTVQSLPEIGMDHLAKRELQNKTNGFSWYGDPVRPGLPLPGNYSGFAGTLAQQKVAASNAFMTALLWFLVLLGIVAFAIALAKLTLELLSRMGKLKTSRLAYFRTHWVGYLLMAMLRAVFIAFFMFVFLSLFQFTLGGSTGVIAIAAIVFSLFALGMFGSAVYALRYRLRGGKFSLAKPQSSVEPKTDLGVVSASAESRESLPRDSSTTEKVLVEPAPTKTRWKIHFVRDSDDSAASPNEEDYVRRFGWLAARFRRSRWWFFALWLVYEFVRACILGGAAGHALIQVFGLMVVEFVAFVAVILLKPFEGKRLNVVMVYILGFSKVSTVALSCAFDNRFNLPRISTTIIGVVIIVIQGLLTISLLVAIAVGAIGSYMSLTRNRDTFKPKKWAGLRQRYFTHLAQAATDQPPPPPPTPEPIVPTEPVEPYFKVGSVRREPKIEDDEGEINDFIQSKTSLALAGPSSRQQSRAQSIRSQTSVSKLPYGARRHRASWSSRDFELDPSSDERISPAVRTKMSEASLRDTQSRQGARERALSRNGTPTFSSRTNTPDVLSDKPRHRLSISSAGFEKIDEGQGVTKPSPTVESRGASGKTPPVSE